MCPVLLLYRIAPNQSELGAIHTAYSLNLVTLTFALNGIETMHYLKFVFHVYIKLSMFSTR